MTPRAKHRTFRTLKSIWYVAPPFRRNRSQLTLRRKIALTSSYLKWRATLWLRKPQGTTAGTDHD